MQRISSRLIQHRSWTGAAHSIADKRIFYRVVLDPPYGLRPCDHENRESWYKSFLEACKIVPDKINTISRSDEYVFEGYLLKDQAKKIPTMDGFDFMKRIDLDK